MSDSTEQIYQAIAKELPGTQLRLERVDISIQQLGVIGLQMFKHMMTFDQTLVSQVRLVDRRLVLSTDGMLYYTWVYNPGNVVGAVVLHNNHWKWRPNMPVLFN